jgi:hypothetical protein
MPLGRGRVGRQGVLGGRPVARTAAVVGTAAVVKHGHDRRADRRETGATGARTDGMTAVRDGSDEPKAPGR